MQLGPRLPNATSLPQQKILHDEIAFAPRKRAAANTTGYLMIG
jgi:hypothetical protein